MVYSAVYGMVHRYSVWCTGTVYGAPVQCMVYRYSVWCTGTVYGAPVQCMVYGAVYGMVHRCSVWYGMVHRYPLFFFFVGGLVDVF